MRSFTTDLRKDWVRLAMLSLVLASAGCDHAEKGTGRRAEMRCAKDGVCWQSIGKRSFEGAYRKGDKEFKFDAVFSPSRTLQTNFRDEWSYRVMDHQGVTFFTAASSNPPDGWSDAEKGQEKLPQDPHEQMDYLKQRSAFATEMAHALLQVQGPQGKLQTPWQQLCRHMDFSFIKYQPNKTEALEPTEHASAADRDDSSGDMWANLQTAPVATESHSDGFTGEALLDDMDDHVELAEGETVSDQELALLEGAEGSSSQAAPVPQTAYGFGRQKNKHTHPAELQRVAGFEFKQDLDLFWKHTRSFLMFGWKTGKHHTAACITVKKRPLNAEEEWQVHDKVCTENHGSKAGEGDMKLYASCNDMPTTKEWYVWKGECGGKYPTHFCNDDTALQIRHAYGLYDDGQKCLKRKRTHRPWCEQPW